jgi:rhomboid family GlyGly-CTERM serine protease
MQNREKLYKLIMLTLPLDKKYLFPVCLLCGLCSLLMAIDYNHLLEFDRDLIIQGEIWRLFTGQFVHTNWNHLVLNLVGIVFIWLLHAEHRTPIMYFYHVCFLAVWTGLGLYLLCPNMNIYSGLSGLLHGVIVWGAIKDIDVGKRIDGLLLLLGVWFKLAWEQYAGPSTELSQIIESTVAIDSHLIGGVGGLFLAIPIIYSSIKNRF